MNDFTAIQICRSEENSLAGTIFKKSDNVKIDHGFYTK